MTTPQSTPLSLNQYTKDIPPGWRPRSYPIREYREALEIWSRLTRLEQDQLGAAVMSRLEGPALRAAQDIRIQRMDARGNVVPHRGIDAVSLPRVPAQYDGQGNEIVPIQDSGIKVLTGRLFEMYGLDDQDLAWTSLDRFFTYRQQQNQDFISYLFEWEHLYEEAERHGGLQMGESAKAWLFWSRTTFADEVLSDLRLKVNGDLSRWREMVQLQLKVSKNELAANEQHTG